MEASEACHVPSWGRSGTSFKKHLGYFFGVRYSQTGIDHARGCPVVCAPFLHQVAEERGREEEEEEEEASTAAAADSVTVGR